MTGNVDGALITLDSNTGRVYSGQVEAVEEYSTDWLEEIEQRR